MLDNAQDFQGAIQAYSEACVLLQQLMEEPALIDDCQRIATIVSPWARVHLVCCC